MDDGFVDLTGGAGAGGGGLEDEWEQLVVTEIPSISAATARSSTSIAGKHNGGKEEAAPINKTLRILERLEAPNRFLHKDIDVAATTNKLIRPNFQRLKRKHKWTPDGLSMLWLYLKRGLPGPWPCSVVSAILLPLRPNPRCQILIWWKQLKILCVLHVSCALNQSALSPILQLSICARRTVRALSKRELFPLLFSWSS